MRKPTGIEPGISKAEYAREYYKKNKNKIKEQNKKWANSPKGKRAKAIQAAKFTARRGEFLNSHKNVPCMDCGKKYPPYVMDFDHRDPSTKSFTISQRRATISLQALENEIAKCDIICANCHRERTWGAANNDDS